jgi:hypothetical protein
MITGHGPGVSELGTHAITSSPATWRLRVSDACAQFDRPIMKTASQADTTASPIRFANVGGTALADGNDLVGVALRPDSWTNSKQSFILLERRYRRRENLMR